MSEQATGVSILKKLHAIMKDCGYIQKDKRNDFHKYNYASEAAIKEKLHGAMVEHGVIPQFNIVSMTEREITRFKEGKQQTSEWLTNSQIYYKFSCIETGESVDGTFFGSGIDPADKGLYKSVTGAIKYILTSQFLIATGDDPEQDEGRGLTKAEKTAKAQQVAQDKIQSMKDAGTFRQEPTRPVASLEQRKAAQEAEALAALEPHTVKHPPREDAAKAPAKGKTAPGVSFKMLETFAAIKKEIAAATGEAVTSNTPRLYYEVLKQHGFAKSSDIADRGKGLEVYEDMGKALTLRKEYNEDYAELKELSSKAAFIGGETELRFHDAIANAGYKLQADIPPDQLPALLVTIREIVK